MEQGKSQMHHRQKKLTFMPRTKFTRVCGALTGQTFSGHWTNNSKATLENITVYGRDTYVQKMGMTLKDRWESVIPHMQYPKDEESKFAKYIWHLE